MLDRVRHNPKIKLLTNTVVEDVFDASQHLVTGVRLKNLATGEIWEQDVDGFFVAIGHIPNTSGIQGADRHRPRRLHPFARAARKTNIPGVFHAGDVQDRVYRQAITAAGAGCMAAMEAERYLETEGH